MVLPLLDLTPLVMFIVALGICLLAFVFIKALFAVAGGAVGWIPWLGSRITGDLHRVEQRLTNALGGAVAGLQHKIGTTWHSFANLIEEIGSKITGAYELLYALVQLTGALASWKGVMALYHSLVGMERAHVSDIRENTKGTHKAMRTSHAAFLAALAALVKAQAIPHDVVLPRDLTVPKAKTGWLAGELGKLWGRIRALERPIVGGIALGALTAALGRIGLGWARCSNVGKVGKSVCGMNDNLLGSLLAGSLLVTGSISIVDLAKACQEITGACEDGVKFFVREVK